MISTMWSVIIADINMSINCSNIVMIDMNFGEC